MLHHLRMAGEAWRSVRVPVFGRVAATLTGAVAGAVAGALAAAAVLLAIALGGGSVAAAGESGANAGKTAWPYAHAAGAATIAGTGQPGFGGDGGSAIKSELQEPSGIAEDARGDLFIADTGNCRVREVVARSQQARQQPQSFGRSVHAGEILTVAGGSCSNTGSDPSPTALAVDRSGDLFIAYASANRVEELAASTGIDLGVPTKAGKLTLVAGTGVAGSGSDAVKSTTSELDDPSGVAVDPEGDLLVSDTGNCRLRLVAASDGNRFGMQVVSGDVYTIAGTGICGSGGDGGPALQAQLWDPGALAVDSSGDVLVADQGNRSIRELAVGAGTFYGVQIGADDLGTVAGEGSYGPYLTDGLSAQGEVAEINFPVGIAVDSQGDLYIADEAMHVIRFVAAAPTVLSGKPASPGDMYIAAGALSTGSLDQQTTWVQTRMLEPDGLAVSSSGRLIYSDSGANVVRELPPGA